jgi:hypothetical protein
MTKEKYREFKLSSDYTKDAKNKLCLRCSHQFREHYWGWESSLSTEEIDDCNRGRFDGQCFHDRHPRSENELLKKGCKCDMFLNDEDFEDVVEFERLKNEGGFK